MPDILYRLGLRENGQLLNALCHRDYFLPGGAVNVAIFDDRTDIWSDGILPFGLQPEDLCRDHNSRPRNPLITDLFFRRGLIEQWGRGTQKIMELCEMAGSMVPEFDEMAGSVMVRFRMTPEVIPEVTRLTAKLIKVVEGEMSRSELQARLHLKDPEYFRKSYLNVALQEDLIERTIPENPSDRRQKYRLTEAGRNLRKQLLTKKS